MSDSPEVRVLPASTRPGAVIKRYWYLLLGAVVAVSYFVYWWAFYAFSDQHYAPLQPIPYSHKLHAGELGMDCQYCHFNAARGKHAGVPPISVCLGCHDPAKGGAGQDLPNVQKMLELVLDGDGKPRSAYRDTEDLDYEGDGALLTGGVVHWNRIHKLPDHVYFSHEWHVKAGVSCQTCHGPIEEMEVVQQHAPLTMGWCIECHRDNNYVGGPDYDGTDASFSVGVANYDVVRARVAPDLVVPFEARHTAGAHHGDGHDTDAHVETDHPAPHDQEHHDQVDQDGDVFAEIRDLRGLAGTVYADEDDDLVSFTYFTNAQSHELLERIAENDDQGVAAMPRWRVPDLPSIHAQFYNTFRNEAGEHVPFGMVIAEQIADRAAELGRELSDEEEAELRATFLRKHIRRFESYQNASTQCSTCHQ